MINFKNMSTKEKVLFAVNPQLYLIGKGTQKAIEKVQSIAENENSTMDKLKEEAARQEIIAQVSEAQARVSQELAIAQRINTAQEVEIEEFYDTSGKGGLSANITEGTVTAGLTGEGRKVTKRIYRFTGWHDGANEVFDK
ncbi:hypothetical protein V7147_23025 [Bacillus sp. JJ1521]|uniref:hypothetical protein n=1 Tax=Bacillus sp. JJ1521 TaxID=3122957 RepID=UPI002FFE35F1